MLLKNNDLKVNKKDIFIFSMIFVIINLVGVFIVQYFNKKVIDYLTLENITLKFGLFILFFSVIFDCSRLLTKTIELKFVNFKMLKITNKAKEKVFTYTINHSMSFFDNSFSGDISSKISNIGNQLNKFIDSIAHIISNIIFFILSFIFYVSINIYIAISFLISAIIYLLVCEKYSSQYSEKRKIKEEKKSNYFGFVNDVFLNIINVKSFSHMHFEKCNSNRYLFKILKSEKDIIKTQTKVQFLHFFSTFVLFFSTISVATILLSTNKITSGDFVIVVIILHILKFSLRSFMRYINQYYASIGALNNSIEKLYQPIEINNKTQNKLNLFNGKIVFNNITFDYEK